MRVDPASSEFSSISLTTDAGRSTTSPAAIWLATASESTWMRPMRRLGGSEWSVVSFADGGGKNKGGRLKRKVVSTARSRRRTGVRPKRETQGPSTALAVLAPVG